MGNHRAILGIAAAITLAIPHALLGATINVPADQSTIQAGIDAAVNGDTVLVSAGRYLENINFNGKAITVASQSGPTSTIIDGGTIDSVAIFSSGETRASVLKGFTLTHGSAYSGGGIYISSSPTISGNVIRNNRACSLGGGIAVVSASPLIKGNWLVSNSQTVNCVGGDGGGIGVWGSGAAKIINNRIVNNSFSLGGGISLSVAGTAFAMDNLIKGNVADVWVVGYLSIPNFAKH